MGPNADNCNASKKAEVEVDPESRPSVVQAPPDAGRAGLSQGYLVEAGRVSSLPLVQSARPVDQVHRYLCTKREGVTFMFCVLGWGLVRTQETGIDREMSCRYPPSGTFLKPGARSKSHLWTWSTMRP